MKNKLLYLLLTIGILGSLCLAACGDNSSASGTENTGATATQEDAAESQSADTGAATAAEDSVIYNGTAISLNENMADVLATLGDDYEYSEAKSCLYEGMDKTYDFTNLGITIITYPQGEDDFISSITVAEGGITCGTKVQVGAAASDIETAYGADNLDESKMCYLYETDEIGYAFYLTDEVVDSIEMYIVTE